MKNLKDEKTKIYPSTMRGGKELPSSSALDSPSVMSKLATPKRASAINSDMSPSLPSTPRKVPSGHGTKYSILYLHSLGVRPMMIVRLSGHPLV